MANGVNDSPGQLRSVGISFAYPYSGPPFEQLGAAHLAALFVIGLLIFLFCVYRQQLADQPGIRYGFAIFLFLNELSWHAWYAYYGLWNIRSLLPLNLCNLMVIASVYSLISNNQNIFEFVYLLGIPSAIQVLITPALGSYGFPHVLFFQIFISHGGIILAALYLVIVKRMRPEGWRSVRKVVVTTTAYVILIFSLNFLLGSNYLFLAHKPPASTLIDYLGPWPWYILSMEIIGVVCVTSLYLPFYVKDLQRKGSLKLKKE